MDNLDPCYSIKSFLYWELFDNNEIIELVEDVCDLKRSF